MHSETTDSTRLYELLAWLELNRKRVIILACSVLAVIVLYHVYSWYRAQRELKASHALLSLRTQNRRSAAATPPSPAEILDVAARFGATDAGKRAVLLAASGLYTDGKYAEAQAQFERFVQQDPKSPLASIAALGVASCLDALDRTDAAVSAYRSVIDRYAEDAAATQARLALAALYEDQKQPEKALDIYDELTRQGAGGPGGANDTAMEASSRRERLLQRHPNLARVTAPPLSTTVIRTNAPASTNAPAPASSGRTNAVAGAPTSAAGSTNAARPPSPASAPK